MPGYSGTRSRSAAGPMIGTIRATRNSAVCVREPSFGFPDVVVERDRIADGGLEISGRPLVQNDGIRVPGVRLLGPTHPSAARSMAVIVEYGMSRSPMRMEFARYVSVGITFRPDRSAARVAVSAAASLRIVLRLSTAIAPARPAPARAGRNRRRAQPREASAPRRRYQAPAIRIALRATALIEQRLHPGERHEDRANRSLARAERKLAEILAREHLTHRQPHAPADVLFPAVQRFGWNRGRILDAKDHRLARRRPRALRQAPRSTAPRFAAGAFTRSRP